MRAQRRCGQILADTLRTIRAKPGSEHGVLSEKLLPSTLQPGRVDTTTFELQISMASHASERLAILTAHPIRILHVSQPKGFCTVDWR